MSGCEMVGWKSCLPIINNYCKHLCVWVCVHFIFAAKRDENYIKQKRRRRKNRRKIAHFICNLIYDDNIHRRDMNTIHTRTPCFFLNIYKHFICIVAILGTGTLCLCLCLCCKRLHLDCFSKLVFIFVKQIYSFC